MKGLSFIYLSMILLTITGCGGGSSDKPTSTQNISDSNSIEVNNPPRILADKVMDTLYEDHSINLELRHFAIEDIGNSLDDLSLRVLPGENYALNGVEVTPNHNYVGPLLIPVIVSDGENESAEYLLEVTVLEVNDPPEIVSSQVLSINEDTEITLTLGHLEVKDIDNNYPQDFTLRVFEGKDYDVEGSKIKPHENYTGTLAVPVVVSDGEDASAQYWLEMTVLEVNDPPEIVSSQMLSISEDGEITLTLGHLEVKDIDNNYPQDFTLSVFEGADYVVEGSKIKPHENYMGTLAVPVMVSDGENDSDHHTVDVLVNAVNDTGQVEILGNLVVGQTLDANVIDDDGTRTSHISYQWQRIKAHSFSSVKISNKTQYTLTEEDVDSVISVTATYIDDQNFPNEVLGETEKSVQRLPIIKKTIGIDSATSGMTVFDNNQLKDKFYIEDFSGYSLKEITTKNLMKIAKDSLIKQVPASAEGYDHFHEKYTFFDEASLFELTPEGEIVLMDDPVLPQAYVGTGENKTPIGESHTLALFDNNKELHGLINIRFSPSSITPDICLYPVGTSQFNLPVVLVHGWMGFHKANLVGINYWSNIANELANTSSQVFTAQVDPWTTPEIRGEQLIAYVECVLLTTTDGKVDIIGHSLGSPTARYAAYWLDRHDGHIPTNNAGSKVRSVTSVSATNYGGNLHLLNASHMQRTAIKATQLYKVNMLLRDNAPSNLLFKIIDPMDLTDPETDLGKQVQLANNITNQLKKNDLGLLSNITGTLIASKDTLDTLVGNNAIFNKWIEWKDNVKRWVSELAVFASGICLERKYHPPVWPIGPRPGECEKYLRPTINAMVEKYFVALEKLKPSSDNIKAKLNINSTKSQIDNIRSALDVIQNEFVKLYSQDGNPDYYELVSKAKDIQRGVSNIAALYDGIKTDLTNFHSGLNQLNSMFTDYLRTLNSTNTLVKEWLFKASHWGFEQLFLGMKPQEITSLRGVLIDFRPIFQEMISLSDEFDQDKVKRLIKGLSSVNEEERNKAAKDVAALIERGMMLLKRFDDAASRGGEAMRSMRPRWGLILAKGQTPLSTLSEKMITLADELSATHDTIEGIKSAARVVMNNNDASWEDIIRWEANEVQKIKKGIIADFLQSPAAIHYGLSWTKLEQCIFENENLLNYFQDQISNGQTSNYTTPLPTEREISSGDTGCSMVINGVINTLVDNFVPMEEINPMTGKIRSEEILEGIYAVSSYGAQMFNLKYPDTGIVSKRVKDCLDDPDFSVNNFDNRNRPTKYYAIIGERTEVSDNFSDRAMINAFVSSNNPAPEDTINNPAEFFSSVALINRKGMTNPTGDMTQDKVSQLFENTDIVVTACSQEIGEVVRQNGLYTFNLNHSQSINQSAIWEFDPNLINLFGGKQVDGYATIDGHLDRCNGSDTLIERKECLLDLFPRIIIMYATGTAIRGMNKGEDDTLQIFDLLMALFKKNTDFQDVEHIDVPKLYRDHLEYVQTLH